MGLLDFLSSKPAANNAPQGGLVVTPPTSQNYTSTPTDPGPVVQRNYKDLQYPIPGTATTQLGATTIPEATGLQPKLSYPAEQQTKPEETTLPHVETILDNGVRQVNHTNDVQPATLPPVEPVNQPLYSYSNNPVPADVLVAQAEATEPVIPEAPVAQELTPLETANIGNPIPTVQTDVPGVSVTQPAPAQQIPQSADESKNGDIIEIGSAAENPVSDESQQSVITAAPTPQPVPIQSAPEVPAAEVKPVESTEVLQPLASEQPVVEVQPQPSVVAEPVKENVSTVETPVVEQEVPDITEIPSAEVKPVEEKTETLPTALPENKVETESVGLNILNKVAFISLNSQSVNSSLSKKIKSLAEVLAPMVKEAYIDSNKGYGMDIISGLNGSKIKVTAAYLKPFFSKYSDETNLDVPLENLTRITFSTVLDRIKYLYKEATVFIVPETSGLNSLAQVTLLLNSQAMYYGTHKPVILFGTAWRDRMNTLKNSFALSQQEMDSMYFASTPEETIELLKKLDSEFSAKNVKSNEAIDMRDEQGEKEGLLSA